MTQCNFVQRPRDAAALCVVALFMFPVFWWAPVSIRPGSAHMLPVHIQTIVSHTWGYPAALGICALIPAFAFIVLVQNHLVRGFTPGLQKA